MSAALRGPGPGAWLVQTRGGSRHIDHGNSPSVAPKVVRDAPITAWEFLHGESSNCASATIRASVYVPGSFGRWARVLIIT